MENQEGIKKFQSLVKAIGVGVLITHSSEGTLKGRPMSTAEVDDEGKVWFFTNEFSNTIKEVSKDNEVVLSYSSPDKNSYIVINGTASLSDDKVKMKALWNPLMKAWFPQGLDDPKMRLLEIIPSEAEYWDGSSSKIVMLGKVFKAILTGQEYKENNGHGKIEI